MLVAHPPIELDGFVSQSCNEEEWERKSAGGVNYSRGAHKAFDFQAPEADRRNLFAVCSGRIKHVNFGPYLGTKQFVILRQDGSGFFYAHTDTRLADGRYVRAGDYVGQMGNNSSLNIGVHLHLEYLTRWNDWYSSARYGTSLRALQEELMEQLDRIEARVAAVESNLEAYIRHAVAFVMTGYNAAGAPWPDSEFWTEQRKYNLRAILNKIV